MSAEVEAVINTALQYNPAERYPSADAMKDALLTAGRKTGVLNRIAGTTASIPSSGLKPLWTFQCEDEIRSTPVHYNGVIYVGCYDHNLYALNAASGEFQWKYATDGGVVTRPAAYENNIYFCSEDCRRKFLGLQTGPL